jgi:hypothetical protein
MANESGPHVKSGLVIFGKEDGRPVKSALPSKAEGPASEVYRIKDDMELRLAVWGQRRVRRQAGSRAEGR